MKHLPQVMADGQKHRPDDDFFATPPEATLALAKHIERSRKHLRVWEPSCGDGAISKALFGQGFSVVSSDLNDHGFGETGVDFLHTTCLRDMSNAIITNPPYKHAEDFIRHGWSMKPVFMAMLLKADFWNAKCRYQLGIDCPPAIIMPLTWRLDFTGQKKPIMNCQWVIWHTFHVGQTTYIPLMKPENKP